MSVTTSIQQILATSEALHNAFVSSLEESGTTQAETTEEDLFRAESIVKNLDLDSFGPS
jgi:hypothetical protein